MITVLDLTNSTAVAIGAGLPVDASQSGIGSAGRYVVYQNHRYRIDVRSGQYTVSDISVYDDQGRLATDATDVYINAITDAMWESAKAIVGGIASVGNAAIKAGSGLEDIASIAPWLLLAAAGLWFYFQVLKK